MHLLFLSESLNKADLYWRLFKQQYPHLQVSINFLLPFGMQGLENIMMELQTGILSADGFQTKCRFFLNIVKPAIALFVKYEFWYYYLTVPKKETFLFLVSGVFREASLFKEWYDGLYRKCWVVITTFSAKWIFQFIASFHQY